jgi:hypothetical protein
MLPKSESSCAAALLQPEVLKWSWHWQVVRFWHGGVHRANARGHGNQAAAAEKNVLGVVAAARAPGEARRGRSIVREAESSWPPPFCRIMGKPILEPLTFGVFPCHREHDGFHWINVRDGRAYVGKVRCRIWANVLRICSIMVFTEFRGRGYGRKAIDLFKDQHAVVVADRVRHRAIGF